MGKQKPFERLTQNQLSDLIGTLGLTTSYIKCFLQNNFIDMTVDEVVRLMDQYGKRVIRI